MPPLTDPMRLEAYKDALRNWKVSGYIEFALSTEAHRWIRRELDGIDLNGIRRLMFEHVEAGGAIDEIKETRPEWAEHEFHYDLRFTIQNKVVYIESRLFCREPLVADESWILVVNIHER